MNSEQAQLKKVIDGFLAGDSVQFRIIHTKITQYVYHQHFGFDVDRDDLISEVIEILLDSLRKDRFFGDSLKALNVYIYNIIRNRIGRVLRRRQKLSYTSEPLEPSPEGQTAEDDAVAAKELAEKVFAALDDKCRDLLKLKYQKGWSDDEIAEHIKKTKNATSTAISRCLDKARDMSFVKEAM